MASFEQSRVSRVVWPWPAKTEPAPKPESCHKRAMIQAAVMTGIAALLSLKYRHAAVTVSCVAAFVLISGVFVPKVFLAVERGFQKFGLLVGHVLTWLLLVPFFGLVFVPARIILLLSGKDPMDRKFPRNSATGWVTHTVRANKDHYTKQYK